MFEDIILFEGERFNLGSKVFKVDVIKNPKFVKPSKEELVMVLGGDKAVNRMVVQSKNVDILLSPESNEEKDFMHFRNSGLNHVLCELARKNDVAIGFSFSEVLNAKDRPKILGRMMQNVRLCRKYKVRMILASFAKNKWEMRSSSDLISFARCIGMTPGEAKKAVSSISEIIEKKKVFISEGIKLVK